MTSKDYLLIAQKILEFLARLFIRPVKRDIVAEEADVTIPVFVTPPPPPPQSPSDADPIPIPSDPLLNVWTRALAFYRRQGFFIAERVGDINILFISGMSEDGALNQDQPGRWNDLSMIVRMGQNGWEVAYSGPATTTPGVLPTKSGRALERGGVASIVPGQYIAWSAGYHRPAKYGKNHPAMVQVKPITIARDKDQNFSQAGDKRYTGVFGVNMHSTSEKFNSDEVGFWSEGCAVNKWFVKFQKGFMATVYSSRQYKENKNAIFAGTFIKATEL